MRLDELPSARRIHNPVNNPDDIDNAFDDITYSKGGAVLSMFESFLSPTEFQKGIHAYLTKFAFKNASARDFIGTIAQATHHPEIVRAFNDFIDQPHIPLIRAEFVCSNGSAAVRVTQTMYTPIGISMPAGRWKVPLCVAADGMRACKLASPPEDRVTLGATCPKTIFPNDEGAGYYRFSLPQRQWQALIRTARHLSPGDQLTLLHNVSAALRAGKARAADFYGLVAALAPVARWGVIESDHRSSFGLSDMLHDLRVTGVLAPEGVKEQQAFVRDHFGPRLQSLGLMPKPGEAPADALLRQYLVQLLVEEGGDTELMAHLAKAARTYLESDGKDRGGIPPELLREAMRAGVMSEDVRFSDALLAAFRKSDDEYFLQSAIYALAGSRNRATLDKLLAMSLTPAVRIGDLRYVFRYFGREPAAKDALWAWFKSHFPAYRKRLSRRGMSGTPEIQKFGCDARTKTDLHAFFAPKTGDLEGTPRTLKQNEDRIDRCIAFKAAKGAEISAALRAAI